MCTRLLLAALSLAALPVACGGRECPVQTPAAATSPAATPPKADPPAPTDDLVKTPDAAIARLFGARKVESAWFTESFARAIPMTKVQSIVDQMKGELGPFEKLATDGDRFRVVFAKGTALAEAALDERGRFATLWFGPTERTSAPPLEQTMSALRALPGKVGVLVMTDGKEVAAHEPDAPLAVGSAFKLAILDVLRERAEAKKLSWKDTVLLEPEHKSLPSGFLQSWPDGAPLTVYTLAALMISQSDNTATDVLLHLAGRANVEKVAPTAAPFLSTREAFVLKQRSNAPLLARFRAGDDAVRRSILAEIAKMKLGSDLSGEPYALDVEWHVSARKLCDLLARNKALPFTHINPGVANASQWDLVAYKGGSEPGVMNLSTWVEKAGHSHCVVTTWNDPEHAVDAAKLGDQHQALLGALRGPT